MMNEYRKISGSRGDQLREKNYNKEDARLIERRTSTNNH